MTKTKNSGSASAQTTTSIQIYTSFILYPENQDSEIDPASLQLSLKYNNSSNFGSDWILEGSIENLSVALLADYFDNSCREGAMKVLGNLTLRSLDMIYTYASPSPSSFLITAILELGELELDMSYQYVSALNKGKSAAQIKWGDTPPVSAPTTLWAFEASLRVNSPSATIASVAESIVPGSAVKLPNFVGQISVAPQYDPTNSPIKLRYSGDDAGGSILTVWVSIESFNLTFIQYRTPGGNHGANKKILRISVDQIPLLDKVPLVNQLPQPFDHLIYLWVEDDDNTTGGFTRALLSGINNNLASENIPAIQFKETKKTQTNNDLLLPEGHHFLIITNGIVVLDHLFHASASDTTPKQNQAISRFVNSGQIPVKTAPPAEAPVTTGDTQSKAGPFSI